MGRKIRDTELDTRAARARLKARGKPYYRLIDPKLHLGYRRLRGGAGKWVVRMYAGDKAYVIETVATADDFSDTNKADVLNFREAQDRARRLRDQRSQAAAGVGGPYTVGQAMDDYLSYLESEHRPQSSIGDAKYKIEAFIRPKLGDSEVAELKAKQLRTWLGDLARQAPRVRTRKQEKQRFRKTSDARARRQTANRVLTTLKAALNHAFDEEKVPSNKAWGRRLKPFEDVGSARPGHLSIAEAKRLVNAADQESGFRDLVRAALFTGCRYGELCRLKVRDFEFGKLAILISKSGKARHVSLTDEGKAFFEQITAGRKRDDLMLQNRARVARALETERERLRKARKPEKAAKVDDDGAWRKSEQARPMADACANGKIDAVGFHQLRHSYASLATMNGTPLLVLAKNLGHADTRMVERHYGHLTKSYVEEAIREGAPTFDFKSDDPAADKVVAIAS
jgi:integrase